MADVFSKKKRSEIMSLIRSKDTGIEKSVFAYLRKRRVHFQRHYSRVAGKPDIAVPSKRKAVFINGDFWHGYRFKDWKHRIPRRYWRDKIMRNIERDLKNCKELRRSGWKVLNIWGHEVVSRPEKTCAKVTSFLQGD